MCHHNTLGFSFSRLRGRHEHSFLVDRRCLSWCISLKKGFKNKRLKTWAPWSQNKNKVRERSSRRRQLLSDRLRRGALLQKRSIRPHQTIGVFRVENKMAAACFSSSPGPEGQRREPLVVDHNVMNDPCADYDATLAIDHSPTAGILAHIELDRRECYEPAGPIMNREPATSARPFARLASHLVARRHVTTILNRLDQSGDGMWDAAAFLKCGLPVKCFCCAPSEGKAIFAGCFLLRMCNRWATVTQSGR